MRFKGEEWGRVRAREGWEYSRGEREREVWFRGEGSRETMQQAGAATVVQWRAVCSVTNG